MKSNRLILGLFICLSLAACKNSSQTSVIPGSSPVSPKSSGAVEVSTSDRSQIVGTSSGGGGFADGYAMETLDLAKYALAQMIKNTTEDVFSKFPKEKNKDWIVKIIEDISYEDVEESRYDRPLKFNYDLEKEKIYATKYFSSTFPYGRFKTRSNKEKLQILNEVILDILHELSHFYGIGNTEETDDISDEWAYDFLGKGLNEVYFCKKGKDIISIHAPSGMGFVDLDDSYGGVESAEENDQVEGVQALKEFSELYGDLSFFGIDNEATSQIEESEETQVDTLISLALSNKSNSSVRLDKYKLKKEDKDKRVSIGKLIEPDLDGVFSYSSGSSAGSLYRFDSVEVSPTESRYSFTYSELVVQTDDELVIWGEDSHKGLPLLTQEVMSIDKVSGEAKYFMSVLNLEDAELDDHLKEKLNNKSVEQSSAINCDHHFEVMDNSEYK